MSIYSKFKPSSKLSAIALAVSGDSVAITLSLIGIGVVVAVIATGAAAGPLAHSWSIWGFRF